MTNTANRYRPNANGKLPGFVTRDHTGAIVDITCAGACDRHNFKLVWQMVRGHRENDAAGRITDTVEILWLDA